MNDDAYGRVTNPERYAVVVDAARSLVDELVASYDVVPVSGDPVTDFTEFGGSAVELIRLQPSEGAPLAVLVTDFPGVILRAGRWGVEGFPVCGCDACDESPDDLIEELRRVAGAVVAGRYEEWLTRRRKRYSFSGPWGSTSREERLRRRQWRRLGEPLGSRRWPPWPPR